jgi:vacuolar-type H+-ATPase subunit E/Vma4
MNADAWKITALTLVLALLLAGAPMSFAAESTASKDVAKNIDETAHSIKKYSAEQRDEALKNAKRVLDDADVRIDHFESKIHRDWDKMNASSRKQAQETMKMLRRQRQDLSQSYGELKRSSANAWDEVKDGFSKSYDALRDSFSKASKKF